MLPEIAGMGSSIENELCDRTFLAMEIYIFF